MSLIIMLLFATVSFANSGHGDKDNCCFTKQIKKSLDNLDLSELDDDLTIMLKFTINSFNEIVVMSTGNSMYDKAIKYRLNYLKIEEHSLQKEKLYTIPLTLKGKA